MLGLNVTLMYIPGETRDQLSVHIPSLDILCVGDNYYKTFPNLYSIRGMVYSTNLVCSVTYHYQSVSFSQCLPLSLCHQPPSFIHASDSVSALVPAQSF